MLRKNKEASRQKNELSEKVTFLSSIFSDNFDSFKKFSPKEQLYKKEIEGLNRDQALDYINVLAEKFYMLP